MKRGEGIKDSLQVFYVDRIDERKGGIERERERQRDRDRVKNNKRSEDLILNKML